MGLFLHYCANQNCTANDIISAILDSSSTAELLGMLPNRSRTVKIRVKLNKELSDKAKAIKHPWRSYGTFRKGG